ncbi:MULTISPECIES: hypothetical protein [Bacteroides]|uniref:hypothetical protein n=1 Tax=Bacteroides TaxID=816 RepID=UPI001D8BE424|nr:MULTISPECIES: hypothetical protein [Bacteroides]HJD91032.1 hypothetical protein [Bacteroides coprosuis]
MRKSIILIFTLVLMFPLTSLAQRGDVLRSLSDSFDKSKEALNYTVSAIENMTEAYKNISTNNAARFVTLVYSNLSYSSKSVQQALQSAKEAETSAEQMNCLTVKESVRSAKALLESAEQGLDNALLFAKQAKEENEKAQVDANLKQTISPIEMIVKDINEALDLFNGAAYELNQCTD